MKRTALTLTLCLFVALFTLAQQTAGWEGRWILTPEKSTHVVFYRSIRLEIQSTPSRVRLVQRWEERFPKVDSLDLSTDGKINLVPVTNRVWPPEVFMGVSMVAGSEEKVTARWLTPGRVLQIDEVYKVLVSQGAVDMHSTSTYTLSEDGQTLTVNVQRDSRAFDPLTYTFYREGAKHADYLVLKDDWKVKGGLGENAFLLSLQGIVNTDTPQLYFIYPDNYDYRFTPGMFDFYRHRQGYSFTQLHSMEEALTRYKGDVKGYIIWDQDVRTSLNVAFTLAGLEKAVVITADMLPLVQRAGLKEIADLRGRFKGMNDAAIYSQAYDQYWKRCNKGYVVWMGGVTGEEMIPGIADFGIAKGCFFTDLSTSPKDTVEYALAQKIFSHMPPLSMVMGWHSYAKDLERNYVTLASNYGLRVEGLNTFPNLSFSSKTPPSPGFTFKNHHNIIPGKEYVPGKKVYITCVQTDGLGLGAWTKPGRGTIPYAWEVTINWQWMAPVMLEYYYTSATPNDYFFGSLSGPGYMYPKAIPPSLLPSVIRTADTLMHKLDLNVFETMDYSEGSTVVGNTDIPKYIVEDYYRYMPDAIGFLNGYAPSFTFYSQKGRPFISYDYYLDEHRPVKDAVADLQELTFLNKERPYFLLLHIREWNNIDRVKQILDQLGSNVEVVPLDIFLKMAGHQPTFRTRFLEKK